MACLLLGVDLTLGVLLHTLVLLKGVVLASLGVSFTLTLLLEGVAAQLGAELLSLLLMGVELTEWAGSLSVLLMGVELTEGDSVIEWSTTSGKATPRLSSGLSSTT